MPSHYPPALDYVDRFEPALDGFGLADGVLQISLALAEAPSWKPAGLQTLARCLLVMHFLQGLERAALRIFPFNTTVGIAP